MTKIKYDKETKILSIRLSNKPSVDSEARGNVIIDYDKEGKIVNVEIMRINLDEFKKTNIYLNQILRKERVAV